MNIVEKVEKFIKEKNIEAEHMLRTGFWIRQIFPEADEAMHVAAICHDIERCFPLRSGEVKPPKTGEDKKDEAYLIWHGRRSAEFAEQLLREFGFADETALARIKILIAEHSFGGTQEKDLMRDADSISFFENNAELFIREYANKEKLKEKFDSDYDRISSEKAKILVKPFYDQAIERLKAGK